MPGAGVLNILEWRKKKAAGETMTGTTPLEIAGQLAANAATALSTLPRLREMGTTGETAATLDDIEAMSHLGNYYAAKIRGAASLALYDLGSAEAEHQSAIKSLESAARHWRDYARVYSSRYRQPVLYNRVGVVDIPALIANVDEDIEIARTWKPRTIDDAKVVKPRDDRPFEK